MPPTNRDGSIFRVLCGLSTTLSFYEGGAPPSGNRSERRDYIFTDTCGSLPRHLTRREPVNGHGLHAPNIRSVAMTPQGEPEKLALHPTVESLADIGFPSCFCLFTIPPQFCRDSYGSARNTSAMCWTSSASGVHCRKQNGNATPRRTGAHVWLDPDTIRHALLFH